jgi:hypothetical protein
LVVGVFRCKPCDAEDEIQLCNLVMAFDLFGVGHELFIYTEERGLMQNGEERGPFLEVDVYSSIRKDARGRA